MSPPTQRTNVAVYYRPTLPLLLMLWLGLASSGSGQNASLLDSSALDALLFGEEVAEALESDNDGLQRQSSFIDDDLDEMLAAGLLDDLQLKPWQHEWSIRTGVGATDNALFTPVARAESLFTLASVEYLGFRIPETDEAEWFLYLLAENRHYQSVAELRDEYLMMAQTAYRRQATPGLHWEIGLASLYNDRVFGLSPLEDSVIASPVVVLQNTGTVGLEQRLGGDWSFATRLGISHAYFRRSSDDYLQPQPELTLIRESGQTKFEAGLRGLHRQFSDRNQQDREGFAINESRLRWESLEGFLSLRHEFGADQNQVWQTSLSGRINQDNGGGYHDFHRIRARQSFAFQAGPWEWSAATSMQWTEYPERLLPENRRYHLWSGTAEVSLKRKLGRLWTAELTYTLEETQSADPLDRFSAHQGILSLWRYL